KNNLSHDRGVISMARSTKPNSASSQFFICDSGNYKGSLDGKYAAFGRVIAGMDVVDKIAAVATDASDRPTSVQRMKSVKMIDKATADAAVAAEAEATKQ
ncbi:MAG: peptidylprolyl isomerase, partial [Clostridia bacterium]|nr:peptidylprolyl isomerase [Clostridia bacterium]